MRFKNQYALSLSLKKNKQSGFTLIELMVVMAIIAILATAGLSAYTGYLRKARDFVRVEDLKQIKNALELYYIDKGHYPIQTAWWHSNDVAQWKTGGLGSELRPYLPVMPVDPINTTLDPWDSRGYSYAYGRTGDVGALYNLVAQFEDTTHPLRCALQQYIFFYNTATSTGIWCTTHNYSKYMYAANPQRF